MLDEMKKMLAEQLNCDENEIPAEELTELETVGDVIEYLKGRGIEA